MEIDTYEEGVPSWVDVTSGDPDATAAFFTALWGWECPEGAPEFGGYRSCSYKGRTVAGIAPKMDPNMPSVFSSYVNVSDAGATAALVTANGGTTIAPPMAVGALGHMAIFTDPTGAVFGVWQAGEHKGAGIVNEPGAYSWNELVTDDTESAASFYSAVFGWSPNAQGSEAMPYTEWKLGDRSIGGMLPKRPEMAGVPNHWGVYFNVDDTDATIARVTELGGSVLMPPTDIPIGRFAVVAEPSGATFTVLAMS